MNTHTHTHSSTALSAWCTNTQDTDSSTHRTLSASRDHFVVFDASVILNMLHALPSNPDSPHTSALKEQNKMTTLRVLITQSTSGTFTGESGCAEIFCPASAQLGFPLLFEPPLPISKCPPQGSSGFDQRLHQSTAPNHLYCTGEWG